MNKLGGEDNVAVQEDLHFFPFLSIFSFSPLLSASAAAISSMKSSEKLLTGTVTVGWISNPCGVISIATGVLRSIPRRFRISFGMVICPRSPTIPVIIAYLLIYLLLSCIIHIY